MLLVSVRPRYKIKGKIIVCMLKSRHRSGLNLQVKIVIRVYNVALNMTNIGELLFVFVVTLQLEYQSKKLMI